MRSEFLGECSQDAADDPLFFDGEIAAVAVADGVIGSGARVDDAVIVAVGVREGLGVLLAVDQMSADSVSDGRLARPFDIAVESDLGYWLAVAKGRREPHKVRVFRDWLKSEMADSKLGYVEQQRRGTHPWP